MLSLKSLIATFCLLLFALPSQAQETHFQEGSWSEIIAQAEKSNKWILVDATTEWCYWCKVMEKETFPHPDVATFLNENFISTRMDFEEGEGIKMAMKFRVMGYPTLLIFNPDGQLTGRFSGYTEDPAEFIEKIKGHMTQEKGKVFAFDSHDLDLDYPDFVYDMFAPRKLRKQRVSPKVVEDWLDAQDDLFTEVAWTILYKMGPDTKYLAYLYESVDRYGELYGSAEVTHIYTALVQGKMLEAVKAKDEAILDEAIAMCDKLGENGEIMAAHIRGRYYQSTQDWDQYVTTMDQMVKDYGEKYPNFINDAGWTVYQNVDDPEAIAKAIGWMEITVKANPESSAILDTYAALYYKAGQYELAEKWARTAIRVGKEAEEDVSETEKLLEKILSAN